MVSSVPFSLRGSRRLGARRLAAKRAVRWLAGEVQTCADAEAGRFILLAPWIMGAGILCWLGLAARPPWSLLAAASGVAALGWLIGLQKGRVVLALVCRALALFGGGMALIALRTAMVDAPTVPLGGVTGELVGTLERVEWREDDQRYTIAPERLASLDGDVLPRRVRIVWRGDPAAVAPGDRVALRMHVDRPPGPVLPGGYDFSRHMYFLGIGGSGYAFEPPRILERSGRGAPIEALREKIADRVQRRIDGPAGALTAALITGKRERIPEDTVHALRDAGLAHLLAISGLHMGLVCGFVFWAARYLLTRSERLTLAMPVKKWAAAIALLSGAIYLALSGAAWSAQRAYIMAAVMFGAILFDRQGLSLRNVAVAALIILVWRPEAIASPGFQMSFAAVALLIASYAALEERRVVHRDGTRTGRVIRSLGGLFSTSLLAGLATGPFAAFHFGRVATFGLLGNMLAMPVVTIAVMPALVLAMFLMPIGLDGPVLLLVGAGLRVVISIAQWTSSLPGAVRFIPQIGVLSILLFSVGLMVLTMLRARWRLGGLIMMACAALLVPSGPHADVFISRDLRNVAVVSDGRAELAVLSARRDRFSVEAWIQALGQDPETMPLHELSNCDEGSCFGPEGQVAIVPGREGLRAVCARVDVVILRARSLPGDVERCAAVLIARDENGRHPAASVRLESSGVRVQLAQQFVSKPSR
ncbi:MAG: ComEC family competence protein [Parvularculaceae bacterium]|nr:ComEC family competence protein [Parvularculaceae bacterium]